MSPLWRAIEDFAGGVSFARMQEYVLVATMKSAADARAFKRELVGFFAKHAKEHDKAAEQDDFEWPGKPTAAALAFAKKHGTKWNDAFVWGEEELAGDEPSVAALENKVVVFHDFCSGGLSDDLARVMQKRSGKRVVVESATPVIHCELALDTKSKLARELATMFAQRERVEHLSEWAKPKWAKAARLIGDSEQASFTVAGNTCRFTLPLDLALEDALLAHLERGGAKIKTWRLANAKDIDANQANETAFPAAAAKPARAAKPAAVAARAIPQTPPSIEIVRQGHAPGAGGGDYSGAFHGMASTGKHLVVASGSAVSRWTGSRLEHLIDDQRGLHALVAHGDEIWACGYGYVLRSTDGGKRFSKIQLLEDKRSPKHEDSPQLLDIARDADGVVWVVGFGCTVMTSRDGKRFEKLAPLDKVTITRCVPSPFGLLLLKDNGRLQIARGGKLRQTTLRAKSPLYGACVTPSGAVVIVGHGDWKGAAFRSTDGVSFEPSKLPGKAAPLYGVTAMSDGRLIAGGHEGLLLVSFDDGKTFKPLPNDLPPIRRAFGLFCEHAGAVYCTGTFSHLIKLA